MSDSLDLFTGVLLTAIGLVLIYGSIIYRLVDLVLIIGVLITLFGLYKLLQSFFMRLLNSRKSQSGNALSKGNNSQDSLLKAGVEGISNFLDGDEKKENSKNVLRSPTESALDSPNQMTFDEYMNKSKTNYATDYSPKDVKPIFKESSIDESKQVLRTKPVKEEKSKFKLPSFKRNSSKKPKSRNFAFRRDEDTEQSPDKLYFTPNYEKPMSVSPKLKKKSENKLKLSDSPKRSKEISKALASVGTTETVYDNTSSDDSYSYMPKEMDEELIMPIDEIDLDGPQEVPLYTLSQSENTLYNNVIYDDSDSDFCITPIHAESNGDDYADEENLYLELEPEDAYGSENLYLEVESGDGYYGDDDIYLESYEEESPYEDDGYITVEASDDDLPIPRPKEVSTPQSLPRPTSIASTNPISKKEVGSNLSRPHKKVSTLPRPNTSSNLQRPHKKAETADAVPVEDESKDGVESKPVDAISAEETKPVEAIPAEETKPAESTTAEDIKMEEAPKADEIISKEELDEIIQDPSEGTIQIDPNNPESLPIPKLLNSYVICEKGILTSQEAFEEVASHSSQEILLEAPTIKDMGERFLSSIADIKTRIIVQEFDLADISYVLLLSSLIKKGVEIKTLPMVNSFNLIGDDSHALIISNSVDEDDFEYGAVYTDKPSIDNIKELFESSWSIANDLDISNLNESE